MRLILIFLHRYQVLGHIWLFILFYKIHSWTCFSSYTRVCMCVYSFHTVRVRCETNESLLNESLQFCTDHFVLLQKSECTEKGQCVFNILLSQFKEATAKHTLRMCLSYRVILIKIRLELPVFKENIFFCNNIYFFILHHWFKKKKSLAITESNFLLYVVSFSVKSTHRKSMVSTIWVIRWWRRRSVIFHMKIKDIMMVQTFFEKPHLCHLSAYDLLLYFNGSNK